MTKDDDELNAHIESFIHLLDAMNGHLSIAAGMEREDLARDFETIGVDIYFARAFATLVRSGLSQSAAHMRLCCVIGSMLSVQLQALAKGEVMLPPLEYIQ